jgi:hypothetical protein
MISVESLLKECRNSISIEKAHLLMNSISFDDNQAVIVEYLLNEELTTTQKLVLLDGLIGTDFSLRRYGDESEEKVRAVMLAINKAQTIEELAIHLTDESSQVRSYATAKIEQLQKNP